MKTLAFTGVGTMCLGLSVGAWLRSSPAPDPIFRTRGIEVVDAKGETRVRIGENPRNGLPGIYLYSDKGNLLGELAVEGGDKPFMLFKSKDGAWSAQFLTDDSGGASWQFYSGDHARAAIRVGVPLMTDSQPAKQPGFVYALDKDGKFVGAK